MLSAILKRLANADTTRRRQWLTSIASKSLPSCRSASGHPAECRARGSKAESFRKWEEKSKTNVRRRFNNDEHAWIKKSWGAVQHRIGSRFDLTSQHALPDWMPAWPMWILMTSRMVVGRSYGAKEPDGKQGSLRGNMWTEEAFETTTTRRFNRTERSTAQAKSARGAGTTKWPLLLSCDRKTKNGEPVQKYPPCPPFFLFLIM